MTCDHCGIEFDHAPIGCITFYRIIAILVSCSAACYRELHDRYPPSKLVRHYQHPQLVKRS